MSQSETIALIVFVATSGVVIGIVVYGITLWLKERRSRDRLPKALEKTKEIEPLLEAGEKIAWEGRPVGFSVPPRAYVVNYAALFMVFVGLPAGLALVTLVETTGRMWTLTFWNLSIWGTRTTVISGTPVRMGTGISLPSPILIVGCIVAVIVGQELLRLAGYRARRYAVTDRRVLALDPSAKTLAQLARADVKSVETGRRGLVAKSADRDVRFEGISDPEAARSALEAKA